MPNQYTRPLYNIKSLQEFAETKGGECLSYSYTNSRTKYKWKCKKGHEWEATWANIKNKDSWCPICCAFKRKHRLENFSRVGCYGSKKYPISCADKYGNFSSKEARKNIAKWRREHEYENVREKEKEFYKKNKEKIKILHKDWVKKNRDKMIIYNKRKRERNKEYYKKNKEKIKTQQKKYYQKNKVKRLAKQKENRISNPEKYKEIAKRSYQKNKVKYIDKKKEYRQSNKKEIYARIKKWQEKNREKINSRRRQIREIKSSEL